MKKFICTVILATTLIVPTVGVYADQPIKVYVDGEKLTFTSQPLVKNGSTLVPLKETFQALGSTVEWNGATKTITAKKDDTTIKLSIGSNKAYKNNSGFDVAVAPTIIEGRTYVPLRFVAESFGADVDWNSELKAVTITSALDLQKFVPVDQVTLTDSNNNSITVYDPRDIQINDRIASYNDQQVLEKIANSHQAEVEAMFAEIEKQKANQPPLDLDGIVEPSGEKAVYNSVANPWINDNDLDRYYGVTFYWAGNTIPFSKDGTNIFTLTGSPASSFEKGKTYTSNGISYKYDGEIVFKFDDLVKVGIIK